MRRARVSGHTAALGPVIFFAFALLASNAFAQNPVPFVNQPLVPSAVAPGGPDFTLTVNGTGFVSGATVSWNGAPLTTTFVSYKELTAAVPAADIAGAETASVTVTNPAPGGGTSNAVAFQVAYKLTSPIALSDPVYYTSVNYASVLAAGDFNGDGITDLAVAGSGSQLAVHLGNGDGTFAPATFYLYPGGANGMAVGDFNGDGRLDLAVPTFNNNSPYVFIFLGNGDGTFQPPIGSPTTAQLPPVVGDFNEDGKLDLAHGDPWTGKVTVLLGNGDGTFKAPLTSGTGLLAFGLLAGDFNGDGHLDLLGFSAGNCTNCNSSVYVLLGNGDGTFKSPVAYGTVWATNSALAGDFNGDSELDLAIGNLYTGHHSGSTVSVLMGNGTGTFPSQVDYGVGYIPASLAAGDFDADGNLDIATETVTDTLSPSPLITILRGGSGTFSAVKIPLSQARWAPTITVGDFNRDGYLDFAEVGMDDKPYYLGIILQRPAFSISPGVADFRDQLVGSAKSQDITLTNNTSTSLNISGMSIAGANAADFTQTTTCGTSLPQGSCKITVTFTPGDLGPLAANLVITDSGPGGSQTVPLSGTGVNPTVTLSSTSLDFGLQPLTVAATKSVTLSVSGDGNLAVSSITATGNFTDAHNCAPSVANGASCTINVTFNPTTGGTATGAITITDDATDSPQIITLSGTGIAPSVTLSATSLTFGSQPVSVTSAAQAATLTNNGPGPLTVTSVSAGGTNAGDFGVTTNCVGKVAALANCTINVTFTPSDGGARAAGLSISDNAAPSTQTISLSGTGVAPTLTLASASLTFADQLVGIASSPQTVNITNTGPGPATVTGIVASGDFSQTNNCLGTLAASAVCQVNITFKPTAMGTRTGEINISDDASGSPQTITLTGNGIAPVVSLVPTRLTFANQGLGTTSPAQTVTLTNAGTAMLGMSSVVVNPGFAETNTCGASVGVGASCTISVTFSPSAVGTTLGQLTVTDSALDSPQGVPLTGTGINGAGVAISPNALSFPATLVGSLSPPQTLTLTNTGNAVLNIGGMTPTGDFVLATAGTTCSTSSSVAVGAHCAISVTFTPTTGGARTGAVTIADNASGSPQSVALSGTGEDFTVGAASGSSTSQSVTAGQTATYNLAFTPDGISGTLALSCAGAPAGATCTINPASTALSGTSAADATVTVTTTAKTMTSPSGPLGQPPMGRRLKLMLWFMALLAVAAGFSLAFGSAGLPILSGQVPAGATRPYAVRTAEKPQSFWKTKLCATSLAVILLLVVIWAACGGGGGAAPPPPAAGVSLSASSLTFSSQNMGTTSTAQTVTLTNSGNAALSITSIALGGANGGDFAQTNTCNGAVLAGANCQIKVTFSPTATGTRTGSVTITDDASGSPQSISLSGAGVPPATPPGTYTLTVTGTLTSSSGTLTHTIPLTLAVN